ncbi:UNVERIFIED_CONTAM: hypothetical protein FKN15_059569 [Acipenser sinensis]
MDINENLIIKVEKYNVRYDASVSGYKDNKKKDAICLVPLSGLFLLIRNEKVKAEKTQFGSGDRFLVVISSLLRQDEQPRLSVLSPGVCQSLQAFSHFAVALECETSSFEA